MISPVYFFVLMGLPLIFFGRLNLEKTDLYRFFSAWLFFGYLLISNIGKIEFSVYGNLIVTSIVAISVPIVLNQITRDKKESALRVYLILIVVLTSIDAVWRFTHPDFENVKDMSKLIEHGLYFQVFKTNSIMYQDSNFVSNQLLILIFTTLIIFRGKQWVILLLLLVLLLSCLSRAAIISLIVGLFFYIYAQSRGRKKVYIGLFVGFCLLIYTPIALDALSTDLSFLSKFQIFSLVFAYFYEADVLAKLFGAGLTNGVDVLGVGTHSVYATLIVETGLIGTALFINIISAFWLRKTVRPLLVAYLVASFSLGSLLIPYFWASLWLVSSYERQ